MLVAWLGMALSVNGPSGGNGLAPCQARGAGCAGVAAGSGACAVSAETAFVEASHTGELDDLLGYKAEALR